MISRKDTNEKGYPRIDPFSIYRPYWDKKQTRPSTRRNSFRHNSSFITTQLKWREKTDVVIEPTSRNGLKRTSLIRLSKLTTIDKDLVLGRLGDLSTEELTAVDENLIDLFNLKK
jgi:hypothetical protein